MPKKANILKKIIESKVSQSVPKIGRVGQTGKGILYLSHQGIKECCLLFVADDEKRKV